MSNLKFKHPVNSYAEAKALYEEGVIDLAFNTQLDKSGDSFQVVHHWTAIVTYHPDGSVTFDAAWVSATTANRMHKCKPEYVERINRHKGSYVVTLKDHPGTFDMGEYSRYRVYPDATVVKVR